MLTASAFNVTAGEAVQLSFSPANVLIQLTVDDSFLTLDPNDELTVTLRDVRVWINQIADVKMFRMEDGVTFRAFVYPGHNLIPFTIEAGTSMFLIQSGDRTFQSAPLEESVTLSMGHAEMFMQQIPGDPARVIDPGVEINGITWATRNVDKPGTFAATPESVGMYYQWGIRVGWSSTDPMVGSDGDTTWNIPTYEGDEWSPENDPCPMGWRMPTRDELETLLDTDNVTNSWVDAPAAGQTFTDIVSGESLFLPAAGIRDLDGDIYYVGSEGLYWSSTPTNKYSNHYLIFTRHITPETRALDRINALTARCVSLY
jgi:uncharacterized protein (TIGR02145 family)